MQGGNSAQFGRMLRALRQDRGLTIEGLAEASGVSGRAIGDMERGRSLRPHRGTVTALAQGLRLDEAAHAELMAVARAPRAGATVSGAVMTSPYSLPRGVRDFVGRQTELTVLRDLVHRSAEVSGSQERGGGPVAPPVAVVCGAPGSGKTTLAIRLAEECAPRFGDGAFLVDMRGLDAQPLSAEEAMLRLLGAWGVTELEWAQMSAGDRAARYQAVTAGFQAVLVLDNAGSEAQVRPLLPREGRMTVIVTSRHTLAGLEGIQRLELGALSQRESTFLLRAVVGADRVDAEPQAARSVADLCGNLPLAVRVAANWAATRTNWSLQRLVTRLVDENRRLDALSAGDLRINSAFSLSYSRLGPEAGRMFRLLSLVPGQDFSLPLAAVLADVSLPAAEDALEELLEAGLLMTRQGDRYRFHDLLRLYAGARHRAEDGEEESAAARSRLRTWLLQTAVSAGRWYEPGYGAPPPGPDALVAFDNADQALRWSKAESDNVMAAYVAAFRETAEGGDPAMLTDVAEAMHWWPGNWLSMGHWGEIDEGAVEAGESLADAGLAATHDNYLAWASRTSGGRRDEAITAATRTLDLARATGDVVHQAWAHLYLGWLQVTADDMSPAADNYRQAMHLFTQADEINGYLQAGIGSISMLRKAGREDEAIASYREVLEALADPRNRDRVTSSVRDATILTATYDVSLIHLSQGRWRHAVEALRSIRGKFEARGRYRQACRVYLNLAHALASLGEHPEAATEYRALLELEGHIPQAVVEMASRSLEALAADRTSRLTRHEPLAADESM